MSRYMKYTEIKSFGDGIKLTADRNFEEIYDIPYEKIILKIVNIESNSNVKVFINNTNEEDYFILNNAVDEIILDEMAVHKLKLELDNEYEDSTCMLQVLLLR